LGAHLATVLHEKPGSIYGLAWATDGKLLLSMNRIGRLGVSLPSQREIRVWDVAQGRSIRTVAVSAPQEAAFWPDDRTLAVFQDNAERNSVDLYDVATGAYRLQILPPPGARLSRLSFSRSGPELAFALDGDLFLWKEGEHSVAQRDGWSEVHAGPSGWLWDLNLGSERILMPGDVGPRYREILSEDQELAGS
jgi:Tol biopolymer transport system component